MQVWSHGRLISWTFDLMDVWSTAGLQTFGEEKKSIEHESLGKCSTDSYCKSIEPSKNSTKHVCRGEILSTIKSNCWPIEFNRTEKDFHRTSKISVACPVQQNWVRVLYAYVLKQSPSAGLKSSIEKASRGKSSIGSYGKIFYEVLLNFCRTFMQGNRAVCVSVCNYNWRRILHYVKASIPKLEYWQWNVKETLTRAALSHTLPVLHDCVSCCWNCDAIWFG